MRILITGNMGYIGPVVARHLRSKLTDAALIGADAGYFADCLTEETGDPEGVLDAQLLCDVRELPEECLAGVDAVACLAAISNDPMGRAFESVTMEVNYRAAVELAVRAREAGARSFVFASSCSVYGSAEGGARHEGSAVNPLTAYARSKVAAERDLHDVARSGFQVTCLRFATACGMSPRLRLDLVLNDFVASAIATGRIAILSDGSPWRPLIDVQDMARAIEWGLGRPAGAGGPFLVVNVGSNAWNYQVKDLAAAVQRLLPGTAVSLNPDAQPDRRSYQVDFSLFQRLAPNHQPVHDLDRTVHELSLGLQTLGFDDANFRSSRLMRLKMLESLIAEGRLTGDLRWQSRDAAIVRDGLVYASQS